MWSDNDGPYEGKHYQLAETLCSPQPIQRPAPKILIGGGGEKKTLRLVAKYGDACNLFASSPAEVQHKLEVLARHCENEGTDYGAIRKTILGGGDPIGDPDTFVASMAEYAKLGIDLVEFAPRMPDPVAAVTQIGETIVPRLAQLG
jgi:alkanesulfonate monooxygenase SsuD/methylene tetrahydromethanopterin reductase-like flavin-dependent oxidoreductase (luciferase family)